MGYNYNNKKENFFINTESRGNIACAEREETA